MKNARLPIELQRQFAVEHGEPFDDPGVAMFPHHPGSDERGQFGDGALIRIVLRKLENRGPFPRDRILPDLANENGSRVGGPLRVWM